MTGRGGGTSVTRREWILPRGSRRMGGGDVVMFAFFLRGSKKQKSLTLRSVGTMAEGGAIKNIKTTQRNPGGQSLHQAGAGREGGEGIARFKLDPAASPYLCVCLVVTKTLTEG